MPDRLSVWLGLIASANAADLIFTVHHHAAGTLIEANPLARAVLDTGGVPGLVAFKVLLVGFAITMLAACRRSPWALPAARFGSALSFIVLILWACYPR